MQATARAERRRVEQTRRDAREAARQYIARGWAPIPVPVRSKNPNREEWQHERHTLDDVDRVFCPDGNIGVLTGSPSNGLVDNDLDCSEAARAARFYFSDTACRFGRESNPSSHYFAICTDEPDFRTVKYIDPARKDGSGKSCMLVELRGTGSQTLLPPSLHDETGELYRWEKDCEPVRMTSQQIRRSGGLIASVALLAWRWPTHARHNTALALSGLVLRGGMPEHEAERFIEVVARVASDEEVRDRTRALHDTAEALRRGEAATGGKRLAELLQDGPAVVGKLRQWLELRDMEAEQQEQRALRVVNVAEFLALTLPSRECILDPPIPRQGIVFVHAWRGVGKTFFSLSAAAAVATGGSFLKWNAPIPRRVLYIDGEMPGAVMQERLARIFAAGAPPPEPDYLRLLTPDLQDGNMPDLSTPVGQRRIEHVLDGTELVFVDNLSTLCRTGIENDAESWLAVQEWALTLRRQGITVAFVHHDGKQGHQRGTSRHEDIVDTTIALVRPKDYRPSDGARFEVHFRKNRGFHGDAAEPFEVALTEQGQRTIWVIKSLEDSLMGRVVTLNGEGLKQRDIAKELGVGVATVNRYLKKARAEGLLDG
jgi:hypothetical protein